MTDDLDPYTPIDCAQHSRYELAVMHRRMLQLAWFDTDGHAHIARVTPLDLETINHEEFLIVQDKDGVMHQIRLDRIDHSDIDEVV